MCYACLCLVEGHHTCRATSQLPCHALPELLHQRLAGVVAQHLQPKPDCHIWEQLQVVRFLDQMPTLASFAGWAEVQVSLKAWKTCQASRASAGHIALALL